MAPRQGEILPWLALVEERGGLSAIIQTHAHLDHSGALPLAYDSFRVPIYLTPPTLSIITTLLSDALKIMEAGFKADGELPIYSAQMAEAMLAGVHTIPFARPLWLADDLCVTLFPAGHILGASSVFLESSEGSILGGAMGGQQQQQQMPSAGQGGLGPLGSILGAQSGQSSRQCDCGETSRIELDVLKFFSSSPTLGELAVGKDNNFNLLRLLAAFAVLFSHSFAMLGQPEPFAASVGKNLGAMAVDVFFVTSGFLVCASLMRSRNALDYLRARGFPSKSVSMLRTMCRS